MVDLLALLYNVDIPEEFWVTGVADALRPFLDPDGLGVFGAFYGCPDVCSFAMERVVSCGVSDELLKLFAQGCAHLPHAYVADRYLGRPYSLGRDLRGWADLQPIRDDSIKAHGAADLLAIVTTELDGSGLGFFSFRATPSPLSDHAHIDLTRIGRHLAAAHRLRRRFENTSSSVKEAEAVLDPGGRIQHARGYATTRGGRTALARAVRALERARSRKRSANARAADSWPTMIAQRWTLIEHVESDGRRYLLAVENAQKEPGVHMLSPREREVVHHALQGQHPKAIAYELGLANSTVRVLMARVMAKFNVHSWPEALKLAASTSANDT